MSKDKTSLEIQYEFNNAKFQLHLGERFNNQYLTKRELDVLKGVILGYTAKRIAQELKLSYRTIEAYIDTLKSKLTCTTKAEIITVAMQSGLYKVFFE